MYKHPYTVFKYYPDGNITTENIDRSGLRLGWFIDHTCNDLDYEWEVIYETWEDEEIINRITNEMRTLIQHDFEITYIELSVDGGWNVETEKHYPHHDMPIMNTVCRSDSPMSDIIFHINIIEVAQNSIDNGKVMVHNFARKYFSDRMQESTQCYLALENY